MKKLIAFSILSVLFLTSCMSDNKAWLRSKELDIKAEKATEKTVILDGPAELKVEENGKVIVK